MRNSSWRIIIGGLLLVMGAVALLQNFNVFHFAGSLWGIFWAIVFIAGGVTFLTVFLPGRQNWWAVIPGITLIGLGATIALPTIFPNFPGNITGAIFLASIGIAFWLVYYLARDNWWAIIPGGTMLTLAVVTIVSDYNDLVSGGVFFIGLGITFALLALIPTLKMKWAWIPAGIAFASFAWQFIWPVALIAVGGYFIYRAAAHRRL
jgi:hypothetical protein